MRAHINYESCNPDSRDLLYVGKDENLFKAIVSQMPGLSARRIADYSALKSYLEERMMLFQMGIMGTGIGRATMEVAVYPATILSEHIIRGEKGDVDGVSFIEQTKKHLLCPEAIVILPSYDAGTTEYELERRCGEKGVKFVKESELVKRASEFIIRQTRRENK
ncbi:hypothetical protein KA107_02815 [Candidatus Pacearchaeota archaeon]|nr:hypothetical protein [Candidatus Pacearchaeota archaeon]